MSKISYQLFSSRNFFPVENTLESLNKKGFSEAEGVFFLLAKETLEETLQEATKLKTALDANNLKMPTLHIMPDDLKNRSEYLIESAKILGANTLIIAFLLPENRPSDAQGWRDLAQQFKNDAQPIFDAGLTLAYHNHDFELIELENGNYPLDEIFDSFPELKWEFDVAWGVKAGVDVIELIKKYSDKICALHVKDIAPEGENVDQDGWCNVGEGVVPWQDIINIAKQHTSVSHFVLEHDNPKSDEEFISVSSPNLKNFLANAE